MSYQESLLHFKILIIFTCLLKIFLLKSLILCHSFWCVRNEVGTQNPLLIHGPMISCGRESLICITCAAMEARSRPFVPAWAVTFQKSFSLLVTLTWKIVLTFFLRDWMAGQRQELWVWIHPGSIPARPSLPSFRTRKPVCFVKQTQHPPEALSSELSETLCIVLFGLSVPCTDILFWRHKIWNCLLSEDLYKPHHRGQFKGKQIKGQMLFLISGPHN